MSEPTAESTAAVEGGETVESTSFAGSNGAADTQSSGTPTQLLNRNGEQEVNAPCTTNLT